MSRFHSHVQTAGIIIKGYDGSVPLSTYLKKFFSSNKKYGSKDRKVISELCYQYYRTGHFYKDRDSEKKIMAGLFLTNVTSNEILEAFAPELNRQVTDTPEEKLKKLIITPSIIFPFVEAISSEIDKKEFILSFLTQPKLFIRCRPGKRELVIEKLKANNITFDIPSADCISLPNSLKAQNFIVINEEAVIQDKSSQQVLDFIDKEFQFPGKSLHAWDCCAASGGKSILLHDKLHGNLKLTVSDVRQSILEILKQRMKEAGIAVQRSFAHDLQKSPLSENEKFDIIICDAPCTGSGTWSRTPEQLFYFKEKKINEYAEIQKSMLKNLEGLLKPGGWLFYITCSVFTNENEAQIKFITEQSTLEVKEMRYIKGYNDYADTMFVAVLQKPH